MTNWKDRFELTVRSIAIGLITAMFVTWLSDDVFFDFEFYFVWASGVAGAYAGCLLARNGFYQL